MIKINNNQKVLLWNQQLIYLAIWCGCILKKLLLRINTVLTLIISNEIAQFILDECNRMGIDIEKNINDGMNGEKIGIMLPRKKIFLATFLGIIKAYKASYQNKVVCLVIFFVGRLYKYGKISSKLFIIPASQVLFKKIFINLELYGLGT